MLTRWMRLLAVAGACFVLNGARPADGYSVLTHEQLIDLTWKGSIRPLLLRRYPSLTEAQLLEAHAYAYGGCAIQDLGYYPTGNMFFSDLTHYVRTGDFITALFRNASNANEMAFAVGALSHYVGDTIGHPLATNPAVAHEFPKLAQKYGPAVNYAQGEHQHVRTEFAFDINGIAKHRFAPSAYLKHVGLAVPVHQLAVAYYETYGLGADYASKRNRITLRGYRFAVRRLLPRVAYAETVLHRKSMPEETPGPELDLLKQQLQQADFENGWSQYRKDAGLGTHSLAALIWILPKVGPLSILAIKGPDTQTEDEYVRSLNLTIVELRRQIARMGTRHRSLPNRDLDTGDPVKPGGYPLTDQTYAELLRELTRTPMAAIPPGLKEDILAYYADPNAPITTKKNAQRWSEVQAELKTLAAMATSTLPPPIDPGLSDMPPKPEAIPSP